MKVDIIENNLYDHLLPLFDRCLKADFAIAFVKKSGIDLLVPLFLRLREKKQRFRVVFSTDFGLTEPYALSAIFNSGGLLRVFRLPEKDSGIFHSKLWIFYLDNDEVAIIIGSSNLTRAAMISNAELNVSLIGKSYEDVIAKGLKHFEDLWLSPNSEAVALDFIEDYAASLPPVIKRNVETHKEIEKVVKQRVLSDESVNKQFCKILLLALKAGPSKTEALYDFAQEHDPYLCDSLYDFRHSLRGAQSSLKGSGKIKLSNGKWSLEY
jgi:HKD family nuclease